MNGKIKLSVTSEYSVQMIFSMRDWTNCHKDTNYKESNINEILIFISIFQ